MVKFSYFLKKSFPMFLVAQNLIRKKELEIYFLVNQVWGKVSSTALLQSNIRHKKCLLLTQY